MNITTLPVYSASSERYNDNENFRKCGNSGLYLPSFSLGYWWNFGDIDPFLESREKTLFAFDNGIFCFDLANNYGPPFGAAEETFGRILKRDLAPYRNEIVITTKAGYDMWEGPNGRGSSRRMLLTSLEGSLKRLGVDYVDIFYSHRYDENVPMEETALALKHIVDSGKAVYVGLSNYPADKLAEMSTLLRQEKVPCIIYQARLSLLNFKSQQSTLDCCTGRQLGITAYSPLAKGVLTSKYLHNIPVDSRAYNGKHLSTADINAETLHKVAQLNQIAQQRNQSLAQMALSWLLAQGNITSVILGPRTKQQLEESLAAAGNIVFTQDEIDAINSII